ncbi:MAG: thiamine phosphate synthase [Proteobacteria bacterium]|nr:thiamine phosphate synthase [Pseudomonadota bacterium]
MSIPIQNGVYAITDCVNLTNNDLLDKTEELLDVGVSLLQYRNKTLDKTNKKDLAQKIQSLCHRYNTPFIVNDDLALAKELEADGIHLGQNDDDIHTVRKVIGSKIIGISCYNNLNRAISAEKNGADYVAFGSFFPSTNKPDAVEASIELLLQSKTRLAIPIVAIGGITPENGKQLVDAHADLLAVINGLYSATNTSQATKDFNNLFKT